MTDLNESNKVIYAPGGHLIVPEGIEHVGDVSNVVFTNGLIARANGDVYIYYASSDTRCHVASTTIEKLVGGPPLLPCLRRAALRAYRVQPRADAASGI